MLTFRDATPDDTRIVALCTMASTGLYDFSQPLPDVIYHSIHTLCSRPDTLYSYKKARIAVLDGAAGRFVFQFFNFSIFQFRCFFIWNL